MCDLGLSSPLHARKINGLSSYTFSTQYRIVRTNELISVLCHNHIKFLDTLKTPETAMKKGQTRFYKSGK